MMSTKKDRYIYPLCYDKIPETNKKGYLFAEFYWGKNKYSVLFKYYIKRMLDPGYNQLSNLKILNKMMGINNPESFNYNRYACEGFDFGNYPEIVVPPAAFDFPFQEKTFYTLNSAHKEERTGDFFSFRYKAFINRISKQKEKKQLVVYCSLGTLGYINKKKGEYFFKKMREVVSLLPDVTFIVSTGKGIDTSVWLPLPDNLFVFSRLPQFHLLQFCDIMITHGGMNTITECISKEVPMIVYPMAYDWDQPGNAARVVFHKIGLKGTIRKVTSGEIVSKIIHIEKNYLFYKENIRQMRIQTEVEPDTAIPFINTLLT